MPRNDQVTRQWYLLRQLESSRGATLQELADALPDDSRKHLRTIRRDLDALTTTFSIYTDRVDGQTRWKLLEGSRQLPALAFSPTELMALTFAASRNATTRREVDPYRLWYAGGALYLIAYDHRRQEVRLFAVDRIRSLTVTDHPYQMPLGFAVDDYVQDALVIMRGKPIDVEIVFSKATAAWAKDRIWHPSQQITPLKDGRLRMTLQVADTRELVGWILSFGSGVRVVRPEMLRAKVREEARKILERK